jgi:ataxia telangiectasia mutated family protein
VEGFAEQAFPFILHQILSTQFEGQQSTRKQLSIALSNWFCNCAAIHKTNLKLLINSILYLRTQPLPREKSSADRMHWLEIDYIAAANAATQCGMFKTALLFVEESCSGVTKSSRRSSSAKSHEPTELLLTIFQSIDDPDLYYGVQQDASLSTILARLEYEKDGPRSLAFRGAQYDSHVRSQDSKSAQEAEHLIKALDVLSLAGLSHSLLQAQQTMGMSITIMESMYQTARKLEQWDLPVPSSGSNNAATIYKVYQGVHVAADRASILQAVDEGLSCTMTGLVPNDLSAGALHSSLQSLAVLTEMDEILSAQGSEQFEEMLSRFQNRSDWMKTGR